MKLNELKDAISDTHNIETVSIDEDGTFKVTAYNKATKEVDTFDQDSDGEGGESAEDDQPVTRKAATKKAAPKRRTAK